MGLSSLVLHTLPPKYVHKHYAELSINKFSALFLLSHSGCMHRACGAVQCFTTCCPFMCSWFTSSNVTLSLQKKKPHRNKRRDKINGKVISIHTYLTGSSSDGLAFRLSRENFTSYTWAVSQLRFFPSPLSVVDVESSIYVQLSV